MKCSQKRCENYKITDKGIAASIASRIKYNAKKQNISYDLDRDWILVKLNSIGWCCELTNIPFNKPDNIKNTGYPWNSISIDKIEPNLGYIKTNVRFILAQINTFKLDGDDARMYMLASLLLENKK